MFIVHAKTIKIIILYILHHYKSFGEIKIALDGLIAKSEERLTIYYKKKKNDISII